MASEAGKAPASPGRRVLMFPLPFQGHLNPMLQLADVLHARGLRVTLFHAAFNAPEPVAGYRFVPVGAGVPAADLVPTGSDADFVGALLRFNERLQGAFHDSLREVLEEEEGARPACLVLDSNLRGMQVVADRLSRRSATRASSRYKVLPPHLPNNTNSSDHFLHRDS
ncbi:DIMBOA UDP-glucosyltransferase BX8-like [Triticum aestivum]|uniref:DIMBOA UDP-glucosyltransferase BX8-like n=1 Tax=Triticum aestivum TaxID=4565 RepID=UPI001D02C3EF|nr:DIMBOA UDP-glucosyltransferase BX8-like [Triticum aestivum]